MESLYNFQRKVLISVLGSPYKFLWEEVLTNLWEVLTNNCRKPFQSFVESYIKHLW